MNFTKTLPKPEQGTGWQGAWGGVEARSSWATTSCPRCPWSIWGPVLEPMPGPALQRVLGHEHGHQPVLELELRPVLLHHLICRTPGGAPIGVWQVLVATGVAWQRRAPDRAPANGNALVPWHSGSLTAVAPLLPLLPGGSSKAAFLHSCNPRPPAQPRICPCPSHSKVLRDFVRKPRFFANLSSFYGGPTNASKTSKLKGGYCFSREKNTIIRRSSAQRREIDAF